MAGPLGEISIGETAGTGSMVETSTAELRPVVDADRAPAVTEAERLTQTARTQGEEKALGEFAGGDQQPPIEGQTTSPGAEGKGPDNLPGQGEHAVVTPNQDAVRDRLQKQNQVYVELAGLDQQGLEARLKSAQASIEGYQAQLQNPNLSDQDKQVLNDLIAETQGKADLASKFLTPTQQEVQSQQAEAESKQRTEAVEDITRQTAGVDVLQGKVSSSEQALEDLRKELNEAQTAEQRDDAKITEIQQKIIDTHTKLGKAREALGAAKEKVRGEAGIGKVVGVEQFENLTVGEYSTKTGEQKAQLLIEIDKVADKLTPEQYMELRKYAAEGGKLSIEQAALLSGELSRRILKGDKSAFKDLQAINNRYSEIGIAVLNAMNQSEMLKSIREKMPLSTWEKVLKNAKNNPNLLIALLIIIVGGAFAATAAAAGSLKEGMKVS